MQVNSGEKSAVAGIMGRLFPHLAGLTIVVYLVHRVTLGGLLNSISRAQFDYFIILSIAFVIIDFYLGCAGLRVLISKCITNTFMKETILVRAITRFVGIVNVWAGNIGMSAYYSRRGNLPMAYSSGTFLLLGYVDMFCVGLFSGMFFRPAGRPHEMLMVACMGAGLSLLPLLLLARWISGKMLGGVEDQSFWFTRNSTRQLFASLFLVPVQDLFLLIFSRMAIHPLRAVYLILALKTFNVDASLGDCLAISAVVMLAGSIPLTLRGLGLLQAIGLVLLGWTGPQSDILAATLMISVGLVAGDIAFGFYYLKGGLALFQDTSKGKDQINSP